jgi:hypothetical protein
MIEDMTIRKLAPKAQHDEVQRVKSSAAVKQLWTAGAWTRFNSLYEEPFFSSRQGRGRPLPAAKGSPSPYRAVTQQHLHAALSPVRRTGRQTNVLLPLTSRPQAIDSVDYQPMLARGVPGWLCLSRATVSLSHPYHRRLCKCGKMRTLFCRFCIALAAHISENEGPFSTFAGEPEEIGRASWSRALTFDDPLHCQAAIRAGDSPVQHRGRPSLERSTAFRPSATSCREVSPHEVAVVPLHA